MIAAAIGALGAALGIAGPLRRSDLPLVAEAEALAWDLGRRNRRADPALRARAVALIGRLRQRALALRIERGDRAVADRLRAAAQALDDALTGRTPRDLGDAPAGAACEEMTGARWRADAERALAEAQAALADGNPASMAAAARGLHFLAGVVAGNCALRTEILGTPALKGFYPRIYLTQDRLTEAIHRAARKAGHFAATATR